MPRVAVLTDSTAGVPEALLESLKIKTVAYYLHRGQEVLRDLVTIGRDEFLRWLPSARVAPTTAAPGPGEYLEAYEELVGQGAAGDHQHPHELEDQRGLRVRNRGAGPAA